LSLTCLSICLSVCHAALLLFQIISFFLFLGIQPFFGRHLSMWHSTKHCSLIFTARRYAERGICYANSVRLSVRLSVTRVYCIKTAERIIEILSPSDRPIILVFRHQGSLRKSEGVTPNGGAKYKGGSDIRPICGYISETVRDRGIVTMEIEA